MSDDGQGRVPPGNHECLLLACGEGSFWRCVAERYMPRIHARSRPFNGAREPGCAMQRPTATEGASPPPEMRATIPDAWTAHVECHRIPVGAPRSPMLASPSRASRASTYTGYGSEATLARRLRRTALSEADACIIRNMPTLATPLTIGFDCTRVERNGELSSPGHRVPNGIAPYRDGGRGIGFVERSLTYTIGAFEEAKPQIRLRLTGPTWPRRLAMSWYPRVKVGGLAGTRVLPPVSVVNVVMTFPAY